MRGPAGASAPSQVGAPGLSRGAASLAAAELAVDGGAVPAEPPGDLADRAPRFDQAEQGAALVEVELAVGPWHRRLPGKPPERLGIRASR